MSRITLDIQKADKAIWMHLKLREETLVFNFGLVSRETMMNVQTGNWVYARLDDKITAEIWGIYKEAITVIDQPLRAVDIVQALQGLINRLTHIFKYDVAEPLIQDLIKGYVKLPPGLPETFRVDPTNSFSAEMTYTAGDYRDIIVLMAGLRIVAPLLTFILNHGASINGKPLKNMAIYDALVQSDLGDLPGFRRLENYFTAYKAVQQASNAYQFQLIPEESRDKNILGELLVRKLTTFGFITSPGIDPGNIMTHIPNMIRDVLAPRTNFRQAIVTVETSTGGDGADVGGDEGRSFFEARQSLSEMPIGDEILLEFLAKDRNYLYVQLGIHEKTGYTKEAFYTYLDLVSKWWWDTVIPDVNLQLISLFAPMDAFPLSLIQRATHGNLIDIAAGISLVLRYAKHEVVANLLISSGKMPDTYNADIIIDRQHVENQPADLRLVYQHELKVGKRVVNPVMESIKELSLTLQGETRFIPLLRFDGKELPRIVHTASDLSTKILQALIYTHGE